MTLTSTLRNGNIYDGKAIWEKYMSLGRAATNPKILEWCKEVGMYDPKKGRPSVMGPYWAMWRYAVMNPKEAYPHYEKWAEEHREELIHKGIHKIDFDLFLRDLQEHAMTPSVVARSTYVRWCKEWGLDPKHKKKNFSGGSRTPYVSARNESLERVGG